MSSEAQIRPVVRDASRFRKACNLASRVVAGFGWADCYLKRNRLPFDWNRSRKRSCHALPHLALRGLSAPRHNKPRLNEKNLIPHKTHGKSEDSPIDRRTKRTRTFSTYTWLYFSTRAIPKLPPPVWGGGGPTDAPYFRWTLCDTNCDTLGAFQKE